jgi:hypothetical protein
LGHGPVTAAGDLHAAEWRDLDQRVRELEERLRALEERL